MGVSGTLPVLFSETEVAAHFGLSKRTLQTWRVRGGGPQYMKIGRRVLYAEADLLAFLGARGRAHTSEAPHA
ncbi:helix-turn-helix transcriptional regulator [Xanthobacter agilis]